MKKHFSTTIAVMISLFMIAVAVGCVSLKHEFFESGIQTTLQFQIGVPNCKDFDYNNDGRVDELDQARVRTMIRTGLRNPEYMELFKQCAGVKLKRESA